MQEWVSCVCVCVCGEKGKQGPKEGEGGGIVRVPRNSSMMMEHSAKARGVCDLVGDFG